MKKKILSVLLICSLTAMTFAGCRNVTDETAANTDVQSEISSASDQPEQGEAAPGQEEVLDDGTPWVDYCLSENAEGAEDAGSAKDDFYLYTNYEWMKNSKIKPGFQSESSFTEVAEEIRQKGMAVLTDTSLTGEDAKMAQQLYQAFLDWDARDAVGVAPVQKTVDEVNAVKNIDELTALFCNRESDVEQLFGFGATAGYNDSETMLTYVSPMRLLLSDSAEYTQRTEMGDCYEEAYRVALGKMLPRLGYQEEQASEMLDRALALEAELAGGVMTSAEQMASDYAQRTNNEMDRAGVEKLCGGFPLLQIMDTYGFSHAERYLVLEPAYLEQLDKTYREENLEDIKNYLIVCAALDSLSCLDRECYEISVELDNAMNGSSGAKPDEEVAFDVVRKTLTTPMDRAFLQKYDSVELKEDVTRICEETVAYYRTMLDEEDWLSAETRKKAIEKLDAITINAVYPDKWRDYSGLSIEGLGYYDSLKEIRDFDLAYAAGLPGTKVDHEIWELDILETNAYYNPSDNSINIIRGILGGVVYHDGMSDEELYAGIGTAIGHEISHAFDTNGAQYDAKGNLSDWWTKEDYAAFTARADKLSAYYDEMTAFGGYQVQGQNIKTEAIADMAGVKCMLGILEQKGNADYEKFFDAYASIWRRLNTREKEYYCLMQDSHPLQYLRTNATLQQFEQFHETYDIKEGDGMYLAPEDRVLVW